MTSAPVASYRLIPVGALAPYSQQKRKKNLTPESLAELAGSIKAQGIAQPIVVRPAQGTDRFEIIAGERRWRAAQIAGLKEVPAIVREGLTDDQVMAIHLIENLEREDLELLEQIDGCTSMLQIVDNELKVKPDPQKRSALDITAERLGKSKSWVSRRTGGFAGLSKATQKLIKDGHIESIDMAYLFDELEKLDPQEAEHISECFTSQNSWDPPPTRRQLEQVVKEAREHAERERKRQAELDKQEAKRRDQLEKQAKKAGVPVEELIKTKQAEPPKAESSWDRERRLEREQARSMAPPYRKFAREHRKAILAVIQPPEVKGDREDGINAFGFDHPLPDHRFKSNTPKSPEAFEYHFEMRGNSCDAGRIIEALDPKKEIQINIHCTIAQLRQIEKITGQPIGIRHIEVIKATGKQLATACKAITGKSIEIEGAAKPKATAQPAKPKAKKGPQKKAPAKANAKAK